MKTIAKSAVFKSLIIGAVLFALVLPVTSAPNQAAPQNEVQRVVVTLLQSPTRAEKGELTMTLTNGVARIELRARKIRHRGFALIDRTHASQVTCESKDAEYGSVTLKDGSWIAVAVCPPEPSTTAIAIPSLIRSRASANEASAEMTCWENKELLIGVCYKVGSPTSRPMPQTREHILLARQVG